MGAVYDLDNTQKKHPYFAAGVSTCVLIMEGIISASASGCGGGACAGVAHAR